MTDPIRLLFVCHANMCRSPLAHGMFVHMAQERGLGGRFEVDSAGTWAMEGVAPHPGSVAVAQQHGFDLQSAGLARPIAPNDLYRFNHILAMDRANESDIERLRRLSGFAAVQGTPARLRLLRAVVPGADLAGSNADVPDPIGRGPEAFAAAYEIIRDGCVALLDELSP